MAIAEELQVVIRAEVDKALRDLRSFDRQLDGTSDKARRFGESLGRVGRTMTTSLTLPLAAAGAASIKFAADIERQQTAFGVLLQDVERGNELFEELKTFSAQTPLQLDDITKASQTLLAFGTNAEEVQEQIRMIGDVAQGQAEKLDRISLAFGKIQARGKASMEEINVLIEAGVPIIAELARNLGVAESEIFDLVSSGKIGFAEIEGALRSMTSEGGQFDGMMEKIAQTTAGKFSTAVDNLKLAAAELGKELLPIANDLLDTITDLAQWFGELDDEAKRIILTVGGITAAMGPLAIAIAGVSTAMKTLVAPPTGWIVLAIAGLAALGTVIATTVRRHREYENQLYNTAEAMATLTEEEQRNLRLRIKQDWAEAVRERRDLLEALERQQAIVNRTTEENGVVTRANLQQNSLAKGQIEELTRRYENNQEKLETLTQALIEADDILKGDFRPDVERAGQALGELEDDADGAEKRILGVAAAISEMTSAMSRGVRSLPGGGVGDVGDGVPMLDLTGFTQAYEEAFSAEMDTADAWRAHEARLADEQKQMWLEYYQARVDAAKSATDEISRTEELFANHLNRLEFDLEPKVAGGVEQANWIGIGADVASEFERVLTGDDMNEAFASIAESIGNMIVPGLGTIAGAMIRIAAFFDDGARNYERAMEELGEVLEAEIEARNDALRELDRAFDTEFDVLRDQWERNLIDTDEFVRQMEELNDQYEDERDSIDENVQAIRDMIEDAANAPPTDDDGLGSGIPGMGPGGTTWYPGMGPGTATGPDPWGRPPGHPDYGMPPGSSAPSTPDPGTGGMYVGGPTMSMSGSGTTINITGPVYGVDDLGERVHAALESARSRGRIPA